MPVRDRDDMTDQFLARFAGQTDRAQHELVVYDNGSQHTPAGPFTVVVMPDATIHEMWNHALDEHVRPFENVAFVNNDIVLETDDVFSKLDDTLVDRDIGLVSPNHGHPSHIRIADESQVRTLFVPPNVAGAGGPAGFCFAIPPRVHHRFRFDDNYGWWFGDTDLFWTVYHHYGLRLAVDMAATIEHIGGGSQTARTHDFKEQIAADQRHFERKWRTV